MYKRQAYGEKHRTPSTRMATAAILRETLFLAAEYHRAKEEYKKEPQKNPRPPFDMKLESLLPLLSSEIPAKVHEMCIRDRVVRASMRLYVTLMT